MSKETSVTPTPGTPRRVEYMPISGLIVADHNPKTHDTAGLGRSISRWGFADAPILDERTGKLVAGHGRLEDLLARQGAGENPPEGVTVDEAGQWLAPVQRGWSSSSDPEAAAFLIGHNKIGLNAEWVDGDLAGMLAELKDVDPDLLAATGFDQAELDALMAIDTSSLDDGDGDPALGGDTFAVIVECRDETQQGDLIERFDSEGLTCRPLMM